MVKRIKNSHKTGSLVWKGTALIPSARYKRRAAASMPAMTATALDTDLLGLARPVVGT